MARLGKIRYLACAFCLAAACRGGLLDASTRTVRSVPSRAAGLSAWERAQHGRDILEAIPQVARTRADYTRALDLFRAIYHDAPAGSRAPASIFAVAELLAEQGRTLHDPHSFQAAAGQYRFLRTQYPMSGLVPAALLAEGQVEQDDLQEMAAARDCYTLLIKEHSKSSQAETARQTLATLRSVTSRSGARTSSVSPSATTAGNSVPDVLASGTPHQSTLPSMPTTADLGQAPARDTIPTSAVPRLTDLPSALPAPLSARPGAERRKAAVVSGIRHWSTDDYTRVAIDLGDEVTYEAARVPHPDRILFDLHGTRLAPELLGKTFAVTDDGFLRRIRAAQATSDTTRVVLDVSDVTEYSAFLLPNPARLIIDIHGKGKLAGVAAGEDAGAAPVPAPARTESMPAQPAAVKAEVPAPRVAQTQAATPTRPVPNTVALKSPESRSELAALSQQPGKIDATVKPTSRPIAMTSIFAGGASATTPDTDHSAAGSRKRGKSRAAALDSTDPGTPLRPASPTAAGETSLVRALGLKIGRIVIDAGHGGHDSGTLGAGGIQEKDVVLDVALRLGKMLHERLGAEIIYTRSDDTFIPLETRTAIANKAQADLFLSIHANSSPDETARGVETYYLNFTSQTDALQVAARENAVSGSSIHELSNLVKKIALKDKIEESREFAADVQQSLYDGLTSGNEGLKDRGVKKAPFVVLIGANMPSVLAEISFVTNERDATQLRRPEYRQRVAESLYRGVERYEAGLGETRGPVEQASRR